MNVLVDTSVWADFFNDHRSREAMTLAALIEDEEQISTCGVILAEFFQGIRRPGTLETLQRYFLEMPCLAPTEPETYLAAARLFRNLRARGITVRSTIDCLIVCLAEQHGVLLLSKDRDMHQILQSGLTRVRAVSLVEDPELSR
jgi:predicted nucleic acid-binding protein